MSGHSIGRAVTILVSAALLATLVVISTTAPASAGKPRCFGRTATIVGTAKADVIKGTAKADVIVARGGHDTIIGGGGNDVICGNKGNDKLVGGPGSDLVLGGTGHDKLHGQTGPDRLLGGPGDDAFDGGAGVDLCAQGTGIGPRANCERPPLTVAPPPPAPAPPAPPPKVLAIAYSDLNVNHVYDAGDVMIAQLVDTNGDGVPSKDDTIIMGKYPTVANPGPSDFADWEVRSHVIEFVRVLGADSLEVEGYSGGYHQWTTETHMYGEVYHEVRLGSQSGIQDPPWDQDHVHLEHDSPSQPAPRWLDDFFQRPGDSPLIDVELRYGGSIL